MDNAQQHPTVQQHHNHHLTIIILAIWLAGIIGLALNNTFASDPGKPPLGILLSFALSLSLFTIAYLTIPAFKRYTLNLDMRLLIIIHSWRMLGMGFVMLHLLHQLPGLFAYLAGFGDAFTAIAAVFLTYALITNKQGVSKNWVWRWNTFGLVDFIVAVSIGILTRTDALLAPGNGMNSDIMTLFPFVIIPGFLVQVFMLTHIIIYLQLKHNHKFDLTIKPN